VTLGTFELALEAGLGLDLGQQLVAIAFVTTVAIAALLQGLRRALRARHRARQGPPRIVSANDIQNTEERKR
jgi:uncharacterized membrane protein YhiD involved in acid resistance